MKLGQRWIDEIDRSDAPEAWIPVVNEIASGSCCKYKLDKATGRLSLGRALPRDIRYPANYGFIPQTRSEADDEELDIYVLSAEPVVPLTIVRARVIAGFIEIASDADGPEDRLLAVAFDDPNVSEVRDRADIAGSLREAFESFVRRYKAHQGVQVSFDRWYDRGEALDRVRRGFEAAKQRPAV
jgi:inorganic pyrophosphatase